MGTQRRLERRLTSSLTILKTEAAPEQRTAGCTAERLAAALLGRRVDLEHVVDHAGSPEEPSASAAESRQLGFDEQPRKPSLFADPYLAREKAIAGQLRAGFTVLLQLSLVITCSVVN